MNCREHVTQPTTREPRHAHCPSCGSYSEFTYAGEQRWREEVAKAAGLPPVMTLWHCGNCSTTLLEPDLEF